MLGKFWVYFCDWFLSGPKKVFLHLLPSQGLFEGLFNLGPDCLGPSVATQQGKGEKGPLSCLVKIRLSLSSLGTEKLFKWCFVLGTNGNRYTTGARYLLLTTIWPTQRVHKLLHEKVAGWPNPVLGLKTSSSSLENSKIYKKKKKNVASLNASSHVMAFSKVVVLHPPPPKSSKKLLLF